MGYLRRVYLTKIKHFESVVFDGRVEFVSRNDKVALVDNTLVVLRHPTCIARGDFVTVSGIRVSDNKIVEGVLM